MKAYAGVGSRQTPEDVLLLMRDAAVVLACRGWTLRSGAAAGADAAFERGADLVEGPKEIFLPWPNFQHRYGQGPSHQAMRIAESLLGPAHWSRLSRGGRALHGRNVHQILGVDCKSPVRFILCWHNGTGGTITAVKLAAQAKVPCMNLADPAVRARVEAMIGAWTQQRRIAAAS